MAVAGASRRHSSDHDGVCAPRWRGHDPGRPAVGPLRPKGSLDADEPLLAALDEIVRGRARIFITTPYHVRGSELLWRRWRDRHEVTIFGHEQCTHVERVLVTHGEPVVRDGARAPAAALAGPPWDRP
jgi:hypothetical protein